MWRSRLPLGLFVVVASCQPAGDGYDGDPLGEVPPISDFPRSGSGVSVGSVQPGPIQAPIAPGGAGGTTTVTPTAPAPLPGGGGTGGGASSPPTPPAAGGSGGWTGLDAGVPPATGAVGDAGLPATDAAVDTGTPDGATPDAGCSRLLAPDGGLCFGHGCIFSLDPSRGRGSFTGGCSAAAACGATQGAAPSQCTGLPSP